MNKKQKQNAVEICSLCGRPGVQDVRLSMVYKGIVMENLPFKRCPNCHDEYCDLATARLMDQIAAEPETYTKMLKRPVARVA